AQCCTMDTRPDRRPSIFPGVTRRSRPWIGGGVLPARRTASGRRYWLPPDLDRYLGRTAGERPRRTVCYCRVSSQAQRPDLKNQRRRDVNAAINLKQNTVGYTGINAWGQEGSGLAGTAS